MLDAYIIDRIRREREEESREGNLVPLHIEVPRPVEEDRTENGDAPDRERRDRGSVIIDFQLHRA